MTRYSEKANSTWFCFLCGKVLGEDDTPDREPPYRCQECFAAVAPLTVRVRNDD